MYPRDSVILRLHYVPGGHGGHVSDNREQNGILALLQVLANKLYKTYRDKYLTLHNFLTSYDIFISRTALESIILYLYHSF